jgi:hypothetical protein
VSRLGILLALAALLLSACGGHRAAVSCRPSPALVRANRDVAAIKRAAALPVKDTLKGNAATNRATDRFLYDVATSKLDNLVQNRLIDHAAAALAGTCQQCFQALEAERPIIQVEHAHDSTICRQALAGRVSATRA